MRIPNWYPVNSAGTKFYTPWHFRASQLVHCGFSTRIGGISLPPRNSLNLGFTVGDNPSDVLANRYNFAEAIGVNLDSIVVPDQVHSCAVRRVCEAEAGLGAFDHSCAIADTDALITNVPQLTLALHFADCVGIFFVDPVNRSIGAAHAGWRGTLQGVAARTVEAMVSQFDTDPANLLVAIGPSICRHCFEVGEDVASQFSCAFPFDSAVLSQSGLAKWRVDLKMANRVILLQAGVKDLNIAVADECTCCNVDEFFSYRRDGATGRMGGWISLKPL